MGLGAAAATILAGSVAASTLLVATGAKTLGKLMASGQIAQAIGFLQQNINSATSGITVLGRYPRYKDVAQELKARVFNYPVDKVWSALSQSEQLRLNIEFLNESIARGHQFVLRANAYSTPANSAFHAEIQYLLSNGYRIVDEGWRMIR